MNSHIMKKYLKDFKVEASPYKKKDQYFGGGEGWRGHSFWVWYCLLGFVLPLYTVCQKRKLKLWLKKKKETGKEEKL